MGMADAVGIKSFGAYVPRMRLKRAAAAAAHGWAFPALRGLAKGARAFTDWDEDSITMGVEAARDALRRSQQTQTIDVTPNPLLKDAAE